MFGLKRGPMDANNVLRAITVGTGIIAFAGSASAATVTADFDSGVALQHGSDQSLVNGQYASFGGLTLTFQAANVQRGDRPPSLNGQVGIFNTNLTAASVPRNCDQDCDLSVFNGNALIVQNRVLTSKTNNIFDSPNDERGSTIKMTVNFGIDIVSVVLMSISIIDIEENPLEVRDNAYAVVKSGGNGDTQLSSIDDIDLVLVDGDMVFFRLQGSGAIDDITFNVTAVPIPAALPLFATALAGLGIFGWRKRKAAAT